MQGGSGTVRSHQHCGVCRRSMASLVERISDLGVSRWEDVKGLWGFPASSAGRESACNAGDLGSIPGLGRFPGEGKGYPLWCFGPENSMDCTAHGVAKSQTLLSNFHFQLSLRVNNSICCAHFLFSNITVPRQPLD